MMMQLSCKRQETQHSDLQLLVAGGEIHLLPLPIAESAKLVAMQETRVRLDRLQSTLLIPQLAAAKGLVSNDNIVLNIIDKHIII